MTRTGGRASDAGRGRRLELGGEQVEGRQAVRELLRAGRRPVREVWVAEGSQPSAAVGEIAELARRRGVPVRRGSVAQIEGRARTESPQGVVALARPLTPVDLEDLARLRDGAEPFLLVVDGVTDPRNLGALLRSAEVAGVTGVVLPRHRAAHVTPAVTKAAAGAIEYLPIAVVPGIAGALSALARLGVWTVGLDPAAATSLFTLDLATEAVAVVAGAEGPGLSRLAAARCDVRVAIPQFGHLESLNVASAATLALFEIARRRG